MEYFKKTADLTPEQLVKSVGDLTVNLSSRLDATILEHDLLSEFARNAERIRPLAWKHDYNGIPANVYRSTLRVMVHLLMAACEGMSLDGKDKDDFFLIMRFSNKWFGYLEEIEETSGQVGKDYDFLVARKMVNLFLKDGADVLHAFLNQAVIGINLFAPFGHFQRLFLKLGPVVNSTSPLELASSVVSHRKSVEYFSNYLTTKLNGRLVRKGFDFMSSYYGQCLKPLSVLQSPSVLTTIDVQELSEVIEGHFEIRLEAESGKVELVKRMVTDLTTIKYFVIRSKGSQYEGKFVFFVHGGGYVGPTADVYNYGFLDQLAEDCPGLTIINVDIPSSADGRFPNQILQVLDLYIRFFAFHADNPLVTPTPNSLGFPAVDSISVMGDSSGASLVTALTILLNDIRHNLSGDKIFNIRMPRSVVPLYGRFVTRCCTDPSQILLQWMDFCHLNVYTYKILGEMYNPIRHRDGDGNWRFLSHEEQVPYSWMDMDDYDFINHPYLSPLAYDKFDQLEDVQLHILGLNFCSFIYDSVYLAKKWKGSVNFVTLDGLPHGFVLLSLLVSSARDGNRQIFKLVKDSFSC